ncbi:MAG: hypothetical protein KAW67_07130 [Candidatus Eisenbacteria sp.]|nr:hypothetical protein [Candidatus Eisenbacteria bacterium]
MAFKVTWHGHESYESGTFTFEPGESRYFESREHIPNEFLMDHRFRAEAVTAEEAFPPEVLESDPDPRARGTILRFTEVPPPEDED